MGDYGPEACLSPRTWDALDHFTIFGKDVALSKEGVSYYTGFAADGSRAVVLQRSQPTSLEPAAPTYVIYEWSLEQRSAPVLFSERTFDFDLGTTVESMITEMAKSQDPKVVSFSPDLSCIRIGPRVFVKKEDGNYVDLNDLELMTEESSPYFEHVELQKSILVLASRTKLSAIIPSQDRKKKTAVSRENEKPDADKASKEETKNVSPDESKDKVSSETLSPPKDEANKPSDGEADDESATSSNPDSSAWNSAEESWSEASSEADEDVDPALANLDSSEDESSETNESETDSENDSKASVKDDSSDAPVATQGVLYGDSSDDGERNLDWLDVDTDSGDDGPMSGVNAGFSGSENSDGWDSDTDVFIRSYGRSRAKLLGNRGQQGMLMVYDLNRGGHPVQLFKFSHLLTTVLDNSPPAIHPTKPLVVWPLSGGDILFADYRANSYFIRTFKPSTRKATHESVKPHFSPCGKYLHILSLESQPQPITKKDLKKGTTPTTLLSAFLSTHRLSTHKTTRTPPSLIHRIKISLGKRSPSPEIPITVTWTPNHAFISSSSPTNTLSLFRVELFAPTKGEKKDLVCSPEEALLLPKWAQKAEVRYFALGGEDGRAMVVVGSSAANEEEEEGKSGTKGGKHEKTVDKEKSEVEMKVGDNTAKENSPKSDPAKDEIPQDSKTKAAKPKADTSKDTKSSPPLLIYLPSAHSLSDWLPSSAIEELKPSSTAKGSLEPKKNRFIEDDCCC